MRVRVIAGAVSPIQAGPASLETLGAEIAERCGRAAVPLRLAITAMAADGWRFEAECVESDEADAGGRPGDGDALRRMPSLFACRRRRWSRDQAWNAVMLVPTGIDCAVGGHAGDATPAARLLASVCDHLVLHPNVVNASDINEQAENCLYVEGSLICRLLMGDIALRKVRANRILVVTEERADGPWAVDQVVNTASAARATLGVDCVKVVVLRGGLSMEMCRSPSGRAVGEIGRIETLFAVLAAERANYDAVALSTRITPSIDAGEMFERYYSGEGPNPWGGVEAALTHAVSSTFDVPSAHAPTLEDLELRLFCYGRVEPRKAAEAISTSYTFCLLKGLHRAPAVVAGPDGLYDPALIAAEDISCLVVPDGSVGLPTLAALWQGIPVIAVRENANLFANDLAQLPFARGQLWVVDNYFEAAGLIAALKAGIHPPSVRRPLRPTAVETR